MRLEKATQIFLAQFDQVIPTTFRCAPDGQAHVTMTSAGIKPEGQETSPCATESEAVVEWLKHAMEFAKGKNVLFLRHAPELWQIEKTKGPTEWNDPPVWLGWTVYSRIACCYGSQGQ